MPAGADAAVWRSAYALFERAMEAPESDRAAFVAREAAGSPAVVPIVLELLRNFSVDEATGEAIAAAPYTVGSRTGRYEILRKLGQGGMGHVYAARDTELGRMVALKFLPRESGAQHDSSERLIREARACSALNHPHIVTVYEVVREESGVALAMELVEGQPLRALCAAPQPVDVVVRWGQQIAQALVATHAAGIVHRDIKPENIMVRPDRVIKVLDFGLARRAPLGSGSMRSSLFGRSSLSGALGGTLTYMSPEQTRAGTPTPASDIFSLGLVLWEALAGRHPFLAQSPIDTAFAIAHSVPPGLPPGIPGDLGVLLRAMLEKDPAARPRAVDVEQRLAAIGGAWTARAEGVSPRTKRIWLSVAAVAAVAVLAVCLRAWKQRGEPANQPALVLAPLPGMPPRGITVAAVSPDGTLMAYAPVEGPISVRRLSDGHITELRTPPGLQTSRLAWFESGKELLASGTTVHNGAPALWRLAAGDPDATGVLVGGGRDGVPSPDGSQVAFLNNEASMISVANRDGKEHRSLRAAAAGTGFASLFWSRDGKRLSFITLHTTPAAAAGDPDPLWQTIDVDTGRVMASIPKLGVYGGTELSDGRILGVPWAYPANSHGGELIEIRTDPATGAILGQSRRKMPYSWDGIYSSFSASRDGSVMALVAASSYANLNAADVQRARTAAGGERVSLTNLRRLTFDLVEDYPHAWTRDSRHIIFESNHDPGHYRLFRLALDRPNATRLEHSPDASVFAQMTPDGRWILYLRAREGTKPWLMRMPAEGGKPEQVLELANAREEFRCGLSTGSRCVIRSTEGDQFVYRELDAVRGKGGELARTALTAQLLLDWELSPDGKTVASPSHDPGTPRVRLIRLDAPAGGHRTIEIPGLQNLQAAAWTAGGEGLFLTGATPSGGVVVYCGLDGTTQKLLDTAKATFIVPAPDGKKIVFPDRVSWKTVRMLHAPRDPHAPQALPKTP